jgi:biopolymer transport protein ExbD
MAGGAAEDNDEIVGINVTPLVDVMLVLLVIFMVTANYIAQQAIPVELPKAATGEDAGTRNLAFTLDKQSQLYLDGKGITFDQIAAAITAQKAEGKPLQALISADQATPHGAVVKLIDTIRKNGITEFAINIETEVAKVR